jgi:hypothetical protein
MSFSSWLACFFISFTLSQNPIKSHHYFLEALCVKKARETLKLSTRKEVLMTIQRFSFMSLLLAFTVLTHMAWSTRTWAQEQTLAAVMGQMGRALGGIARPVSQGTAGAKEAELTRQLLGFVKQAEGILPDSVLALPEIEREAKAQQYVGLMQELARATEELEAAISVADMNRAKAALAWITGLRTKGHDEFRL